MQDTWHRCSRRPAFRLLRCTPDPDSADRAKAVRDLTANRVTILFVVDLFNEGVDIPCVDLVMFLRPTESMTVFVQQLGRGLRLHEGKQRLIVLDFIGNYRRAHYKLPFLTGDRGRFPPRQSPPRLRTLTANQRLSSLPDAIEIHLEPLALEQLRNAIEAPNSLRESLKADFRRLQTELGRRPSLVDIERRGRYPARQYRMSFSTWLGAIEACGVLTDRDRTLLGSKCLAFLSEIEKTPMTRSYKMVVLDAMLESGRFQHSISLDQLTARFRQHFSKARFSRDIVGTDIADMMHVASPVLDAYVIANPINAWIGGKHHGRLPLVCL